MRTITIETDNITIKIIDQDFTIKFHEGKNITPHFEGLETKQAEPKPYFRFVEPAMSTFESIQEELKHEKQIRIKKLPIGTCVICGREYQKTSNVQKKCRRPDCTAKNTAIDPLQEPETEEI